MNTLGCMLITGLGLLVTAGSLAPAHANTMTPAWQESAHLMDVVIARAPRPQAMTQSAGTADALGVSPAEVDLSADSGLALRAKAAAAVRETLAAGQLSLVGLSRAPEDQLSLAPGDEREPVL